jgi:hypothetical protein
MMLRGTVKVEVRIYYAEEDVDFSGDYEGVEVLIGEKSVRKYEDYYHDKGAVKAEAFVDGLKFALLSNPDFDGKVVVETTRTNDEVEGE